MRKYVFLLFILLILWITGSSYWYVYRVRGDCKNSPTRIEIVSPDKQVNAVDKAQATADSILRVSVEAAKAYLVSSGTQKVYFEISSGTTDQNMLPEEYLNRLKLFLENHPEAKINVTGHTDSSGTEKFNKELGSARAEFVKSFLVSSGINTGQIQTTSKSSDEPAAPNNTSEGRAKNRRTEIIVLI